MIKHGALGRFLAFQADEPDARVGNELKDGVQHAQPGAEDRDEHHFALEAEAAARASGVWTETGTTANERVASCNIRAAISLRTRRNSCGRVRLSRNRVRLCCTSGCAMTVTPFTLVGKDGRQEIEAAFLELGSSKPKSTLMDLRFGLALAEHVEEIGQVVALLVVE